MKKKRKNRASVKLEKEGIRKELLESVISDTHDGWKKQKLVLTPQVLRTLAAIVRSILKRIRGSAE